MTGNPDYDRLTNMLNQRDIEAGTAGDTGNADVARLDRLLAKAAPEPPATPEELNEAEQGPVTARRPDKVAPRFDLKTDLEEGIRKGGDEGTVNPGKTPPKALAFDMGRSRSIQEMREKFNRAYPDGSLMKQIDSYGNEHLLFREKPGAEWGVAGEDLTSVVSKIATPQTAGAIATTVATRGWSLLPRIIGQGAAGVVTEGVDIGIEYGRGIDRRMSSREIAGTMLFEGALGAAGEGLVPGLKAARVGARNLRSKVSLEGLAGGTDYGAGYTEAATALDLPPPMLGQAATDPRARALFRQVSGGSTYPREQKSKQIADLTAKLETKANEVGYEAMSGTELDKLAALQKAQIEEQLLRNTQYKSTGLNTEATMEVADTTVKDGLKKWAGAETAAIADVYTGGNAKSRIQFNTGNLKKIAEELPVNIQGADGELIEIGGPRGSLRSIVGQIEGAAAKLIPTASGEEVKSAVQQVILWRTKLSEIAKTSTGDQQVYAQKLLDGVKDMMANPVGGKGWGPVIQKRVSDALERFEKFEDQAAVMAGYIRRNDPDGLVDQFFQPKKFEALKTLRDVAPEEFKTATDAFINRMFKNPEKVPEILDNFTKNNRESTLRLFMSDKDEKAWRTFSQMSEQYGKAKYNVLRTADTTALENAQSYIFGTGKPGALADKVTVQRSELDDFIRGQPGGKSSPRANELRAGIYEKILNDSKSTAKDSPEGGAYTLDPAKIVGWIEKLKEAERDLGGLMRPQDWETLDHFRKYANMLQETVIGGQLQQQSQVSKVIQVGHLFSNPQHYLMVLGAFVNQGQVARIMSNPISSRMLMEAVEAGPTQAGLSRLNAASAIALEGALRDNKQERENQ